MGKPAVDTAFTCHFCSATITVVGPRTTAAIDPALRRVGWARNDGVVSCRGCHKKRSHADA